jgi:hypothetical protein
MIGQQERLNPDEFQICSKYVKWLWGRTIRTDGRVSVIPSLHHNSCGVHNITLGQITSPSRIIQIYTHTSVLISSFIHVEHPANEQSGSR